MGCLEQDLKRVKANFVNIHGFLPEKSCLSAVSKALSLVSKTPPTRHLRWALVKVDLDKAFDCIRHEAIIRNLMEMGIQHALTLAVKQYVGNRKYVFEGLKETWAWTRSRGVPQGGILSPLLFIIGTMHLTRQAYEYCHTISYADDILLFISGDNANICERIALALQAIIDKAEAAGLTINPSKTSIIIRSGTGDVLTHPTMDSLIDNITQKFTYLGFRLNAGSTPDSLLTSHWAYLIHKLKNFELSALCAKRQLKWLKHHEVKMVWQSYALSLVEYCLPLLTLASPAQRDKIECRLITALKAVYGMSRHASRHLMLLFSLGMTLNDYIVIRTIRLAILSSHIDDLTTLISNSIYASVN